jgi:hypothetical protein
MHTGSEQFTGSGKAARATGTLRSMATARRESRKQERMDSSRRGE